MFFTYIDPKELEKSADSIYINTYKTTPSSRFYIVYCQIYSDYKNFGGGHLELSHEKVDEKNGNSFFPVL